MRIALGLEYDGAGFHGWQSQTDGNTVQDLLERALSTVASEPIATVAAGRTDSGVHALAQVAHFDTNAKRPLSAWVRGCNAHLPSALAVRWAREVSSDFHARFSARARRYRYLLLNTPVRPALMYGRAGWHHAPLDVEAMQRALAHLAGEHDFSSFRAAECQAKSPMKTLHQAQVMRQGEYLVFDFCANAFLHHMVRNIVGALVYTGDGRLDPDWMADLLRMRDRTRAPPTFAAAGLYLVGVDYDACWRFPDEGRIMAPLSNSLAGDVSNSDQNLRPDPQR
jgi:tRNA pseudouridine38-40 synthase